MAKTASSKTQTPDKVPKVKKTATSIVRGHAADNIIHSARKRHPTQRLIESEAFTKLTKRTKKPKTEPAKKKVKRLGTMQVTAKEGKAFLESVGTPTKRSADKEKTAKSPAPGSDLKKKAKGEKSRSRSKSKKSGEGKKKQSKAAKKK